MRTHTRFLPVAALAALLAACAAKADPAVDAFFDSPDLFIQNTVLPNIEKNRKCDVALKFVDAAGNPLPNLKVTGQLTRHAFLFGCCMPDFKDDDGKFTRAWADLFNFSIPANAGKWTALEKNRGTTDFSRLDALLDLCEKNGMTAEFHFLSGYHPDWLEKVPDAEKAGLQKAHALRTIEHVKDRVAFIQVFNEDWLTHVPKAQVYFDQTAFFRELTEKFPGVKFGVSDCWSMGPHNPAPAAASGKSRGLERDQVEPGSPQAGLPPPDTLRARYPGISFLALHAHRPRDEWATPQEMYATFDPYTGSGIPLQLTEFGINDGEIRSKNHGGTWTDAVRAQYFVQVFATAFSHPAVEACNLWGMSPNQKSMPGNALVDARHRPNAAYRALHALLKEKFSTTVDAKTDQAGKLAFRGFKGRYTISVAGPDGKPMALSFNADGDGREQILRVAR